MNCEHSLLIADDTREPVRWLNYARPVVPDPYVPMGPNTTPEWLWPVAVANGGRRVGLSYIAPPERAA